MPRAQLQHFTTCQYLLFYKISPGNVKRVYKHTDTQCFYCFKVYLEWAINVLLSHYIHPSVFTVWWKSFFILRNKQTYSLRSFWAPLCSSLHFNSCFIQSYNQTCFSYIFLLSSSALLMSSTADIHTCILQMCEYQEVSATHI